MKDLIKDTLINTHKTTLGTEADEVIIGDEKSPATFKPQITFTKWNKENSLTIKLSPELLADLSNATTTLSGNKIEHKNGKIGWYANPDHDNADNLKFGIILYEKPLTNTWRFQLGGWEDMDFLYQGFVKNPQYFTQNGEDFVRGLDPYENRICERPINVEGSYAVYHKTKKNYILGQTNYMSGKFGHIYQIKFIDADSNWIWGELDINNDNYRVTCSQSFLDTAKYPIKANDTMGYTTLGASATGTNVNEAQGVYTGVVSAGTLTKIYWGGHSISGSAINLKMGIYDDNSVQPNNLIVQANTFGTTNTTKAWYPAAAPNGQDISGSITAQAYWVAFLYDSANGNFAYDTGGVSGQNVYTTSGWTYPTLNTPFGTHTDSGAKRSAYATYTPSGGAAEQELIQGAMTTMSKFWGSKYG